MVGPPDNELDEFSPPRWPWFGKGIQELEAQWQSLSGCFLSCLTTNDISEPDLSVLQIYLPYFFH